MNLTSDDMIRIDRALRSYIEDCTHYSKNGDMADADYYKVEADEAEQLLEKINPRN